MYQLAPIKYINEAAKFTQLLEGLEGLIGKLILKFPMKWDDWKSFVSIQKNMSILKMLNELLKSSILCLLPMGTSRLRWAPVTLSALREAIAEVPNVSWEDFAEVPNASWEDIGGLENVNRFIIATCVLYCLRVMRLGHRLQT